MVRLERSLTSFAVASLALLLLACSGPPNISRPPTQEQVERLNKAAEGKAVSVTLDDGEVLEAHDFHARVDSIEWNTDSADVHFQYIIATDRIRQIDVRPASFGVRFASGMLGGTVVGLSLAGSMLADGGDQHQSLGGALAGVGIVTGGGLVAGCIYGAFDAWIAQLTHKPDTYRFDDAQAVDTTQ